MAYQNGKTYYLIPLCATGDAAYNRKILNKQVQPIALNTRGVGSHYNNRNVNVYSLDWSTDMQWKVMIYDGFARILCAGNTAYGLDYYYSTSNPGNPNNRNCDIYQVNGNYEDSKINFRTINASENLYKIQCYRNDADNDLYLTAMGTSNGSDVRWQPLDSSKATQQTWWLVPIESVVENTTPSVEYTGILARNTTPPVATGLITAHNIPDCTKTATNFIEEDCEMHAGSSIPNGTDFSDNSDDVVSKIKMAINTFIEKVYPSGTSIRDANKYYYLFGEKRYGTVNSVCHNGVDIRGPDMSPIKALFGGRVTKSGGSVFSIYNDVMGVTFNYVHMASHTYSVNQEVRPGAVIGYQSDVGDADSSHLHFEVTEGQKTAQTDTANVNTRMASILPYGYMLG